MAKKTYVTEMTVNITSVMEIPDDIPEQMTYNRYLEIKKSADKDTKIKKAELAFLMNLFSPLTAYDDWSIEKCKTFITEEKDGDKGTDSNETKSEGDVQQ